MTTLRHLIWMLTAALGLILVASPSFAQAQYQDPGDPVVRTLELSA